MKMLRTIRQTLILLWLLSFFQEADAQPNILLILADDAGYADFGFRGGGIDGDFAQLTPNIDSIASAGVRFSNGYVSGAVCCPSRAGILTGRHQCRFRLENQSEWKALLVLFIFLSSVRNRRYLIGIDA